jgi:hypothetical protein
MDGEPGDGAGTKRSLFMSSSNPEGFLRRVLFTDAATSVACGLLMVAAQGPLGALTHIPSELLLGVGAALFPIGAFMALVAARAARSSLAVGVVVAGNLAWSAASFWLMASGAIAPSGFGQLFLAGQALVVLALTACEVLGLRRLGTALA